MCGDQYVARTSFVNDSSLPPQCLPMLGKDGHCWQPICHTVRSDLLWLWFEAHPDQVRSRRNPQPGINEVIP